MRNALPIFAFLAVTACATGPMPMTREEFRTAVAKKDIETYVVNRRFSDVIQVMKQRSADCLSFRVTHTRGAPATSSMSFDYNASFRAVNATHAELTIQQVPRFVRAGPEMPAGGFYARAVDFDADGARTRLTFYGGTWGWEKVYAAVKQWSAGHPAKCPYG